MGKTYKHMAAQAARTNREPTDEKTKKTLERIARNKHKGITESEELMNFMGETQYGLIGANRYGNNRQMWATQKKRKRKAERRKNKQIDVDEE